jgi:hypothetical protein
MEYVKSLIRGDYDNSYDVGVEMAVRTARMYVPL